MALALAVGERGGDWSLATPTDAQLKEAGLTFGIRYLAPLNADGTLYGPSAAKVIRQPEYDRLQGKVLRVLLLNYEWYTSRVAEGAPAGNQDANWAAIWAHGLGYPDGWPIPFSDDTNSTPYGAVKAYLQAAQTRLDSMPGGYVAGYYGRQANCQLLAGDFPRALVWQTCAWSGGVYGGTAQLYQDICNYQTPIPGVDIDFVKKPITLPGGDMPLDDADKAWITKTSHDQASLALREQLAPGAEGATRLATAIHDQAVLAIRQQLAPDAEGAGRIKQILTGYDAATGSGVAAARDALASAVAAIPTTPVDQAGLERAVTDAVTQALAGGVPVGTVKAEVIAALAEATIPVSLAGHAGVQPAAPA